jgi:NADH dehydrogenase
MNLVSGATGTLGSEICRQLAAADKPVRGLVRVTSDPAKVDALKGYGVALVEGDLKDRASLDGACQGVTAVISTASSTKSRQEGDSIETVDLQGQLNLVDAAKAAGVKHFLFISYRCDEPITECPLSVAKRAVERRVKESGMAYTILRGNFFMEAWLSPRLGFDYPNAKARIYGSGRNKNSWVSFHNVAQFAVTSLDHPAAHNATIDVGGPDALSPLEVIKIFEEVGGREFTVEHVPEETLKAQKASASGSLQESFPALMLAYAGGWPMNMQETQKAFPIRLTSVREYAQRVLGAY